MPPQSEPTSPSSAKFRWRTSVVAPGRLTALAGILDPGETVQWASGPDKFLALRGMRWLWWIGLPWTAAAVTLYLLGYFAAGWEMFVIAPGLVFCAAPFLLVVYASGTVYAITDRRAIIRHDALGKKEIVTVAFADMDKKLEVLPVRLGIGHLYFASGLPGRLSDADYTGKLAFRDIADPEAVAQLLERVRAQNSAP